MWRKLQKFFGRVVPAALFVVYLAVAVCFLNRWDVVVAVTLVPIWAWAGLGAILSLFCWIIGRGIAPGLMFCLCIATAVGFSEETRSIVRELAESFEPQPKSEGGGGEAVLRVTAVACEGQESALRKAAESAPDILVVRGAPDKATLDAVADQLYGVDRMVASDGGLAVLARGKSIATLVDPEGRALHVRLKFPGGLLVDVTSLDLSGCTPSLEMWKPAVWRELFEARVETRRLVRTHLGENPIRSKSVARILAGGFGTPPGDDIFTPLRNSGMLDSFEESGVGWGNTFPSDYPILRLEQIWVSPNLVPVKSEARINPDSEHRIVVSELRAPSLKPVVVGP